MRRTSLTRRSFLARVAGGVAAGGALALLTREAVAHPISDSDSSDGVGAGRSTQMWPNADTDQGRYSDPPGRAGRLGHFSDRDTGPTADLAPHGRRISDHDRSDPASYRPNITDLDQGQYADRPGRGRRPPRR